MTHVIVAVVVLLGIAMGPALVLGTLVDFKTLTSGTIILDEQETAPRTTFDGIHGISPIAANEVQSKE